MTTSNDNEAAIEWREFTGTNEMVLKGDQEMHKTGDTEWHEVSFDVGSTARRNPKYRFRTRRPFPKREEMPMEGEIASIEWSCVHTARAIRYLRDEIQKLKTQTHYHHESYCRKCKEPK
jgi:hypothetical protein